MTEVTMLSWMASKDFVESLDVHHAWGVGVLDLKDNIFGKSILELTPDELTRVEQLIASRNFRVHCLSTLIFEDGIENGRESYSSGHLDAVQQAIRVARVLRPTFIRIMPMRLVGEQDRRSSARTIVQKYPWLYDLYRTAIDQISESGFAVTIENEKRSIFSNVEDILDFFEKLDRPGKVSLTYDVQNLWLMGTYPTIEVYERLKPLIGYYHVKGGQENPETREVEWKSALADATWPVYETTKRVVLDGVSPVICINPCYGKLRDDYSYDDLFKRDIQFMQSIVQRIEQEAR